MVRQLDITLVMLAAGNSTRFCKDFKCKKQWLRVDDKPLWYIATSNILKHCSVKKVILVASRQDYTYMRNSFDWQIWGRDVLVVCGGDTRAQSLANALEHVSTSYMLVSDVARWNVADNVIENMIELATRDENIDCVVPFLKVADTSFYEGKYLNRESLKLIQTPQLSSVERLKVALQHGDFSDESSAITAMGGKVAFVEGSPLMNKLTYWSDLSLHIANLRAPSAKVFIGSGIDVHEFEDGFKSNKPMILGGVHIPSSLAFKAHSDGDVALHALCDAILGAIGGGDIGEWFPDDDMAYKNADSKILLKHIYDFAQSVGYEIFNVDLSIMAQTPKLASYKAAMRKCIAEILHIPQAYINIKATTTEGLGFIGRKEGICVQAHVSMGFINWHKFVLQGGKYEEKLP